MFYKVKPYSNLKESFFMLKFFVIFSIIIFLLVIWGNLFNASNHTSFLFLPSQPSQTFGHPKEMNEKEYRRSNFCCPCTLCSMGKFSLATPPWHPSLHPTVPLPARAINSLEQHFSIFITIYGLSSVASGLDSFIYLEGG